MKSALLLLVCLVCAGASTSGSDKDNGASTSGSYNDGSYNDEETGSYETPEEKSNQETPNETPEEKSNQETPNETPEEKSTQETPKETPKDTPRKKPAFDAAAFAEDLKTYTVVDSIDGVTLPPTTAPTPAPVPEGSYAKTVIVEKQALEVKMPFPITGAALTASPALQKSMTDGMATALGMKKENCKIDAVDGKKLSSRRRLAETTEVTFIIIADTAADFATLSDDVVLAAKEGSIVANIQKAAASNGVLTAALKVMNPEVTIETPKTTTVKVTVVTYLEGDDPTKKPDDTMNAGNSVAPAFGSVMAIVVLSMLSAGL